MTEEPTTAKPGSGQRKSEVAHLDHEQLRSALRQMLLIRHFEERVQQLFKRGQLPGFLHLYIGQEAVAVGASAGLKPGDQITSNHRGHGHVIARGGDVGRMFAELLGKQDGYCRGKGGSMHIVNFEAGMLGTNGIVGAGIPIAAGAAFANLHQDNDKVALSFFGDGATNQGVFFEALNLASLWKLPLILLCENNHYTEWSRTEELTAGAIIDRSAPFNVPGVSVDGNDVEAVHRAVAEAADRCRAGEGPTLIEAVTYRWHGHNEGEEVFSGVYREESEINSWRERDPILFLKTSLIHRGGLSEKDYTAMVDAGQKAVSDGFEWAQACDDADPSEALTEVFATTTTGAAT